MSERSWSPPHLHRKACTRLPPGTASRAPLDLDGSPLLKGWQGSEDCEPRLKGTSQTRVHSLPHIGCPFWPDDLGQSPEVSMDSAETVVPTLAHSTEQESKKWE